MKSNIGTNNMKFEGLSPKEITGIIKTGGMWGVSELKIGGFIVKYHESSVQRNETSQIQIIKRQVEPQGERFAATGGENIQLTKDQDAERAEFMRAQTLISDPEEHEDAMIDEAINSGSGE